MECGGSHKNNVKTEERKVVLRERETEKEKEKEPMVLGQLSAGVTNFLSGFTFPRNKKKISMTNSLGKQQRKKSSCRSNSGERGRYGMLVTTMTRDGQEDEEDQMTSNRIRSVHNPIGSNNSISHSGRSRERRMSSSSATGGGGRKSDGPTSDTQQQQQQNRKLVRIIDHQLDW